MPYAQAQQTDPRADFRVTYHGTVTTITPLSDACREWLEENVELEPWQRFGNSIAVEPRYVEHCTSLRAVCASPSEARLSNWQASSCYVLSSKQP